MPLDTWVGLCCFSPHTSSFSLVSPPPSTVTGSVMDTLLACLPASLGCPRDVAQDASLCILCKQVALAKCHTTQGMPWTACLRQEKEAVFISTCYVTCHPNVATKTSHIHDLNFYGSRIHAQPSWVLCSTTPCHPTG